MCRTAVPSRSRTLSRDGSWPRVALGATGWATGDAGWSAAGERRHRRSDLEGELWAVMGGFGRYGAVWRAVRWWSAVQRTVRYRRLPPTTAPTFTPNT